MVFRLNKSLNSAESIVSLHPHQAAQAQHQLSSLSTVYTPLLACHQQCQRRPPSIAPNFHAERRSPQTTGDSNISNFTILNTREIWLCAACADRLNPPSIVNSMLTKILSRTCTHFPTLNTLKPLQTRSCNHGHLLCGWRKNTLAPALRWAITLLSHGNTTLMVGLRPTYKTIPCTCLWNVESKCISSFGPRRRAWRHTTTKCWKKKTSHCISQASQARMVSRTS